MSSKPFMQLLTSLETDVHAFVKSNRNYAIDSVFFLEEKGKEIFSTVFSKEEKIEALAIAASMLYQEMLNERDREWHRKTLIEKIKVFFFGGIKWL